MSYKVKTHWAAKHVDKTIFMMQASDYTWTKALSIKPRRCYWTNDIITPLSYAMIAEIKPAPTTNSRMAEVLSREFPVRWVSMRMYIYLRLKGTL